MVLPRRGARWTAACDKRDSRERAEQERADKKRADEPLS